jgi:hypothetical protein
MENIFNKTEIRKLVNKELNKNEIRKLVGKKLNKAFKGALKIEV